MADHPPPEFNVGDRVRVVLSDRHQTPHTGTIRDVIWHGKDGCWNYYIEEDGKKVSTRYLASDLESAP
ncbi:MAG: hypothetical protein L0241_31580 [Planctomycetia bacterium]|nr:hypothetical protein [Planctomycetia bacterium]